MNLESESHMHHLNRIINEAIAAGADGIEFERNRGTLEIAIMFGNSGIGSVLKDRRVIDEVLDEIYERAGMAEKLRGRFTFSCNGEDYIVHVRQYESFGETCYELKFKTPGPKPSRR